MAPKRKGPLAGIRVADFSSIVAGPYCTMLLGDLGAEVIKVEAPEKGDDSRAFGPPFVQGESTYFLAVNRNKKSLVLDLKTEQGVELARKLILRSDVLVENFRPGKMAKLGLGYEKLQISHPGLIYCSISGYGQTGPYKNRPGYDAMLAAFGGLMGIMGTPGGPPIRAGVALIDVATGLHAHSGILAALYHRERTGQGQALAVSLLSAELATLINAATDYLIGGQVLTPMGSAHASIVPYQAFQAADGYIVIGAASNRLFRRLCEELGHPEWATDDRFSSNAKRVSHREELVRLIELALTADTVAEWDRRLGQAGVAAAPVNRLDQVFQEPQVMHSGQIVSVTHPKAGRMKLVGPAVQFSRTPAEVIDPPPLLGQHTKQILAELMDPGDA